MNTLNPRKRAHFGLNTDTQKHCKKCDRVRPVECFGIRSTGYLRGYCKDCESKATRIKKYTLTEETYEVLISDSDGVCKLCGSDKFLVLDHDHMCCPGDKTCGNCNRAFICQSCNSKLTTKNEQWILRAAEYITSNRLRITQSNE